MEEIQAQFKDIEIHETNQEEKVRFLTEADQVAVFGKTYQNEQEFVTYFKDLTQRNAALEENI